MIKGRVQKRIQVSRDSNSMRSGVIKSQVTHKRSSNHTCSLTTTGQPNIIVAIHKTSSPSKAKLNINCVAVGE